MDTQTQIQQCKGMLEVDKPLMFDTVMSVKTSPHAEICRAYGVVFTSNDELKIMGADQEWHTVLPNQVNVQYVVQTLYQRLKILTK